MLKLYTANNNKQKIAPGRFARLFTISLTLNSASFSTHNITVNRFMSNDFLPVKTKRNTYVMKAHMYIFVFMWLCLFVCLFVFFCLFGAFLYICVSVHAYGTNKT